MRADPVAPRADENATSLRSEIKAPRNTKFVRLDPKVLASAVRRSPATFLAWVKNWRTVAMFKNDRLLFAATAALAVSALLPLLATPVLPLVDLGNNIGCASLLNDAAFGKGTIAYYYKINKQLVPYWSVYLMISALESIGGPFFAAKAIVAGAVVLIPLFGMRLLYALGRSPRLGLWLFILTWDTNLYWGWITFQYGMAFTLLALAWLVEIGTLRQAFRAVPLTVLIALTHIHSIALLLLSGGLLTLFRRPFWKSLLYSTIALSGCAVTVLPWIWRALTANFGGGSSTSFEWHQLDHKLKSIYSYTLDNFSTDVGIQVSSIGFLILVFGAVAVAALPQQEVEGSRRYAPILLLLAAGALYFALPFSIWGAVSHWWTYPRFASYVLIALLAIPRPRLDGWRVLALVPGLIAAVALHRTIYTQFQNYGTYVQPYMAIVGDIPHGSRVYPLDLDDYRAKGFRNSVLGQLHGYMAAATSSYDSHLWDEPNNPLLLRQKRRLPVQNWFDLRSFSMEQHGEYYDYIIVHPADRDVIARRRSWREKVDLVRESGPWRLYRVKQPLGERPPVL